MIEARPQMMFVLLTNYSAFLSSGLIYAFWKWALDWPAPWIAFVLIFRATYLSFLNFSKLRLELSETSLLGPSGAMHRPTILALNHEMSLKKIFGLTTIRDSRGREISYREQWYPRKEIEAFNRHLTTFKQGGKQN